MSIDALPVGVVEKIVSFLPLKRRLAHVSRVNRRFYTAVRNSIIGINFFVESIDTLTISDPRFEAFFSSYGSQIKHLNYDYFLAMSISNDVSQWRWRQQILRFAHLCRNLQSLDLLFCTRHKLRDSDLIGIFAECFNLIQLRVDAEYLTGHCFRTVPFTVTRLELDKCDRINDDAMVFIRNRCRRLSILHLAQFDCITDRAFKELIIKSRTTLAEISLVSYPTNPHTSLGIGGLLLLSTLTNLRVLCLEGLDCVTDYVLDCLTDDNRSRRCVNLRSLSLAFCVNVTTNGIRHLARLPHLSTLNLDGIVSQQYLDDGLLCIAQKGLLEKLLLAEQTNVSAEAVHNTALLLPRLRLLDISNNDSALNWATARSLVNFWKLAVYLRQRKPLTILTDDAITWNYVVPPFVDDYGRRPVSVVHINPIGNKSAVSIVSVDSASTLPIGLMAPELRRGNRYRQMQLQQGVRHYHPPSPRSPAFRLQEPDAAVADFYQQQQQHHQHRLTNEALSIR